MSYPNVFEATTTVQSLTRLEQLSANTQPEWGKMNAAQMLAHLNVAYQIASGKKQVKLNGMTKFFLKLFVKNQVVGSKPYPKNGKTAPYFLVADEREFEKEKQELIDNIKWVEEQGVSCFEGKHSESFGVLTAEQWSNLFQKHLDHHFKQFGV